MPKKRKFANNAWGTLASSITSTDTTITLTAGHGARFPTLGTNEVFLATLIDSSNNLEIIEVTARSTDTLTVVRGQEGTTARAYGAGDRIELRVTKGVLESVAQKDEDPVFTSHVSMSGTQVREDKGADIVAAATTDLGTATGNYVTITHAGGTLAITSLGGASLPAGTEIETRFSISGGTLSLTHNATNLILPGGENITLANGDVLRWRKEHDSNAEWRLVSAHVPGYIRNPVGANQTLTFGATTNWDASLGQVAVLTLTGNTTLAAPTNLKAGGHYTLRVVQDSVGGRTITWNSAYVGVRGAAMPQPAPSANTTTVYHFVSDGTSLFLVSLSDDIPAPYARLLDNVGLSVAMASNAVTITLTGADGSALSTSNRARIGFRSSTAASGNSSVVSVTSPVSLTISAGSTLGTQNGSPSRIWIAAINNGGTVELAAFNARNGVNIAAIDEGTPISTTAEGGAGGADSPQTWYSATARTNVPFTILGYFESTQATAGTWASAASAVVVNPRCVAGQKIQAAMSQVTGLVSVTAAFPFDDTIPQSTEGTQITTLSITPRASANVLHIAAQAGGGSSGAGLAALGLFKDSDANALAVGIGSEAAATDRCFASVEHAMVAATTSTITLKLRGSSPGGGTWSVNGNSGARVYGGVASTFLKVEEIMG